MGADDLLCMKKPICEKQIDLSPRVHSFMPTTHSFLLTCQRHGAGQPVFYKIRIMICLLNRLQDSGQYLLKTSEENLPVHLASRYQQTANGSAQAKYCFLLL